MPQTKAGRKVEASFKKQYGAKKGEDYYWASQVKGNPGSEKWEGKKKGGTLAKAKATYKRKHGG